MLFAQENPIDIVASRLGEKWRNLENAWANANRTRADLTAALANFDSTDMTVVFFGSLARKEFTAGSDADWTLLVDGPAGAQHLDLHDAVRESVRGVIEKQPGAECTFGSITFSHDVVHHIGGEDDTNRNITQRILLLLESTPADQAPTLV
jgi:predicted nucleotidyltransferase